eukprot:8175299-Heterocapsa_arctica.AAC.1
MFRSTLRTLFYLPVSVHFATSTRHNAPSRLLQMFCGDTWTGMMRIPCASAKCSSSLRRSEAERRTP